MNFEAGSIAIAVLTFLGVIFNAGVSWAILREHDRRITQLEKWRDRHIESRAASAGV